MLYVRGGTYQQVKSSKLFELSVRGNGKPVGTSASADTRPLWEGWVLDNAELGHLQTLHISNLKVQYKFAEVNLVVQKGL